MVPRARWWWVGGEEREGQNEETSQYAGKPIMLGCGFANLIQDLLIVRLFCLCPEGLRSWNNKKQAL